MSAAALKPPMFGQLFASRPDGPDRGSASATLMSLGLHATLGSLLVWASMAQRPVVARPPVSVIPPVVIQTYAPPTESTSPAAGGAASGGKGGLVYALPTDPVGDLSEVPAGPGPDFAEMQPFERGTAPGSGPTGTRGGGGAPTRDDGFRILSVMPALLNQQAVQQALSASYPPFLRDAGIGGQALVWVLLDEDGRVLSAELKESSGHRALDEAALSVAPMMRFSPAQNRDQRVRVWVSLPIRFKAE
jgi:protein TonB